RYLDLLERTVTGPPRLLRAAQGLESEAAQEGAEEEEGEEGEEYGEEEEDPPSLREVYNLGDYEE
ncbi:unnamed protein product, partial [Nesidiocoris tenuis]